MSEKMCRVLNNQSISSIIKDKRTSINNAIIFIKSELKELKKKDRNKLIIQQGIESLENAKDILLGNI
jgi:hypothetical protein